MSRTLHHVGAGCCGGVVFAISVLGLDLAPIVAGPISLSIYGGLLLLARDSRRRADMVPGQRWRETISAITREAKDRVTRMERCAERISAMPVKDGIRRIAAISRQIVDDFVSRPSDPVRMQRFLLDYLDTTVQILERYVEIRTRKVPGEAAVSISTRVENSLGEMACAFERYREGIFAEEIAALDAKLSQLQTHLTQGPPAQEQ